MIDKKDDPGTRPQTVLRADISEHTYGSTHWKSDICKHTDESTHIKAHTGEHT